MVYISKWVQQIEINNLIDAAMALPRFRPSNATSVLCWALAVLVGRHWFLVNGRRALSFSGHSIVFSSLEHMCRLLWY